MKSKLVLLFLLFVPVGLSLFLFTFFSYKSQPLLFKPITDKVTQHSGKNSLDLTTTEIIYPADYNSEDTPESQTSSTTTVQVQKTVNVTTSKDVADRSIKYSIPTLMYHHINPITVNDKKDKLLAGLSVSPDKFEQDLKDIQNNGYETIYPYEVEEKLQNNIKQEKKYAMITIDDGYEDIYKYALPLLLKYKMKATFYVMPNFVARKDTNRTDMGGDYANWDEIIAMKNSGVINIGSHTMDHDELTNLKYKDKELRHQIFDSKKVLEEKLGIIIKDFCYPYGKYNEGTIKLVKEAGYLTATKIEAIKEVSLNKIYEMPRYHASNVTPFRNFLK
ncbi:MAG: polysaccharide deacetylase family protein [bacterium]